MFNNFSAEYKRLMLDTETMVKESGFREVLPEDVFFSISKLRTGAITDIMASYGVNEKIVADVFGQKPFAEVFENRSGPYAGMSQRLKDIIITSVKIAASYEKRRADVEDFLLAVLRTPEEIWLYNFLDFIGINSKDLEQDLIGINRGEQEKQEEEEGNNLLGQLGNLFGPSDGEEGERIGNTMSGPGPRNPQGEAPRPRSESQTPALDFFAIDLTAEARNGKIDAIIGRDREIERLISVLNRKTKNNPCLVGDPGVGKTAVVEGLARRIASGSVPLAMQNKRIMSLDLGGMVAGTKYRGEFEARIKQIIEEASKLENEVVLFIDEIHTIIGAGSGEGTLDAANILKPAMGRGKICVIGATTLNEYQKYIEKDSALERRFQKIEVNEPTEITATEIIRGLRESFENFHNLIIDDDAIEESIRLSKRYITDRFLPDKAIDLVDEACSTKSMKYNFEEDELKELKTQIEGIQKDIESFVLSQQYQKALAAKEKRTELERRVQEFKAKRNIPRDKRLHIGAADIRHVIEQITGIPSKTLGMEERERLVELEARMKGRIIAQDSAVEAVVSALRRSRAGITDRNRPIGSFLFFGPTGVGKTELVRVLAEEFFQDPSALIKIDMSEFGERASASKLIGTTAGYVGYEEGGMLTEKVRRKPYSIVLFDEIEKANHEVFHLLLQILEDGMVTDGKGRKVNFTNTVIVMTSNIGADQFTGKAAQIGFSVSGDQEDRIKRDYQTIKARVMKDLDKTFSPEFINRIDKLVVFDPLDAEAIGKIVSLQLDKISKRLKDLGATLKYDESVVKYLSEKTYSPENGARSVRRYLQDHVEDAIAERLLTHENCDSITLGIEDEKIVFAVTEKPQLQTA